MRIDKFKFGELRKSELTELKEKDACCPKDKKMEVEENKK
jgi:hypothetical protein